jgi:hypothetical protein
MIVDDVVEAIFQRLCLRHQHQSAAAADASMSVVELRLAIAVSEPQLSEALWVLRLNGDDRVTYPVEGRVALGPAWRARCEGRDRP